jgi:hypothetical protein
MKKYSKKTKLAAVHSYLESIESLRTTAEKYYVIKSMLHNEKGLFFGLTKSNNYLFERQV